MHWGVFDKKYGVSLSTKFWIDSTILWRSNYFRSLKPQLSTKFRIDSTNLWRTTFETSRASQMLRIQFCTTFPYNQAYSLFDFSKRFTSPLYPEQSVLKYAYLKNNQYSNMPTKVKCKTYTGSNLLQWYLWQLQPQQCFWSQTS